MEDDVFLRCIETNMLSDLTLQVLLVQRNFTLFVDNHTKISEIFEYLKKFWYFRHKVTVNGST